MDRTKDLLARDDITIKEAWKQLNQAGHKILFVIDAAGVLIGSVSDGDIRRWILADQSIQDPLHKVMQRHPQFVLEADSLTKIKSLMLKRRIECLPVLNPQGQPERFIFWNEIFEEQAATPPEAIDIPVVIMAGGRGVRLDPFTRVLPKPLMPLGDKPILEVIIDRFRDYHVNQFFISVNYRAKMIRAYFQEINPKYELNFFEEDSPLGTAGSLHLLAGQLNSTFIVSNCDILVETNYAELLRFHREQQNSITLVCSMKHFAIPYGVVEMENGHLREIREKPEYDCLINTGLYVLEPELLERIPHNKMYHITDLIEHLRREGQRVGVYPVSDKAWVDIGQLEEYHKALRHFE